MALAVAYAAAGDRCACAMVVGFSYSSHPARETQPLFYRRFDRLGGMEFERETCLLSSVFFFSAAGE